LRAATLGVARDLLARGEPVSAKPLLERLVAAWPASDEAGKARLLLADFA